MTKIIIKNISRGILWATIAFLFFLILEYITRIDIGFFAGWICGLAYIVGSRQFKEMDYNK